MGSLSIEFNLDKIPEDEYGPRRDALIDSAKTGRQPHIIEFDDRKYVAYGNVRGYGEPGGIDYWMMYRGKKQNQNFICQFRADPNGCGIGTPLIPKDEMIVIMATALAKREVASKRLEKIQRDYPGEIETSTLSV